MKKLWIALMFLMLANVQALAQSQPGWTFGYVPTQGEWAAEWSSKQDYLGAAPCLVTGCTLQGKLTTFASSATNAGFNLPPGAAPTSPVNGDIWTTSAGLFAQINGSTVGPYGTGGGGGTLTVPNGGTGQVSFTANAPLIGNGTGNLGQGTRTGNTTAFATSTGTLTSGHCVSIDGSGNFVDAGGACTTGGGGGTVASSTIGQIAAYTASTTVTGLTTCNNGYIGTNGSGTPTCTTTFNATLSATITAVGTIATGVWQGTVIGSTYGGTGINNGSSTLTMGGSVVFSGAFGFTANLTSSTNVTFPTSGTLMNQNGTSGGIPYYSSSTSISTSAALTSNLPVFGGGAGSAPFSGTLSGNTTKLAAVSGSLVNGNGVKVDSNGNIIDFGSVPASLSATDQSLSGGAIVTPFSISTGSFTVDCGKSPLQLVSNGGNFTITAPTGGDGSCIILITNGAGAGAVSFSGFTESANTGDSFTTTVSNKFMLSIVRINGISNYVVRALQ